MAHLAQFLLDLLEQGSVVFRTPPVVADKHQAEALTTLRKAHALSQLDLAGPPLPFHPETARAAAEVVHHACWYLVHRGAPAEELQQRLTLPPPTSAAEHFSADLTLRFLPQLHRRARALAPADALTIRLVELLRQWPLAGVLADVPEPPLTALDFGGHRGLQLLYAERLARREKPGWLPSGSAREVVELVFRDRGKERSVLLQASAAEGNSNE